MSTRGNRRAHFPNGPPTTLPGRVTATRSYCVCAARGRHQKARPLNCDIAHDAGCDLRHLLAAKGRRTGTALDDPSPGMIAKIERSVNCRAPGRRASRRTRRSPSTGSRRRREPTFPPRSTELLQLSIPQPLQERLLQCRRFMRPSFSVENIQPKIVEIVKVVIENLQHRDVRRCVLCSIFEKR